MSEWRLTYRNLVYYARYYRLIALATVIVGADNFGQSGDGTLGRYGDGDRYQLFFPGGYDP